MAGNLHDNSGDSATIAVRTVQPADWPLVAQLFGDKGACGGCWCMYWHAPIAGQPWERTKGELNKQALKELVSSDRCPAVLLTEGDQPIGWCRVGPVQSFERLKRTRKLWRDDMAEWAVVCFYVARHRRGEGLSTRLLRAAADLAFRYGARSVEGYAVVPKGQTMSAAFAWTGLPATFERAGFVRVEHDSGSRRIYRLERGAITKR